MSDLIRREDAIEAITYSFLNTLTREERIAHIKAIPSADVKPMRHGRWETVFMSEATGYDPTLANYIDAVFCHRCSACKEDARLDEFGEEMLSKYCPNCGTKMDKEEKNDETG